MAFAMSRFLNVKALYEGFIVKINGRDWTINIMIFGETTLVETFQVVDMERCLILAICGMKRHGMAGGPWLLRDGLLLCRWTRTSVWH